MSSSPKLILITGANTGLGYEILRSICRSSHAYTILVGSRDISKGETAITQIKTEFPNAQSTFQPIQIDLCSDTSITSAVETIEKEYGRIDTLLNNGGAAWDEEMNTGTLSLREGYNKTWDTNVTGTQILTTLCVPLLLRSPDPRLIFMTSGTSSLGETENLDDERSRRINSSPAAGWPKQIVGLQVTAYRSAKTGLNMVMRDWARILKNDGVKVWCVSPGFLVTGLNGVGQEKLRQVSKVFPFHSIIPRIRKKVTLFRMAAKGALRKGKKTGDSKLTDLLFFQMGALEPHIGADFTVKVIEGQRDHETGKVIRNNDMIQPW